MDRGSRAGGGGKRGLGRDQPAPDDYHHRHSSFACNIEKGTFVAEVTNLTASSMTWEFVSEPDGSYRLTIQGFKEVDLILVEPRGASDNGSYDQMDCAWFRMP